MQARALGDRLREERDRLSLTQDELGQIGGVNRNSQGKYEKGERNPDSAYLEAIAAAGVDVLYVLTGKRQPIEETALTKEEQEIVAYLRGMSDYNRESVRRMAFAMAAADGALDSRKS
ncbi:transcriptional regulator with XRE-family HTH domain [Pseudomonas sp. SORGH_AS 211]|uniref:Helix-turn-helix domain-containing protein n=1 Tax=Pseudomonas flavocrustae TaxID=2991719 RepID=A0ABT6IFD3_9PSED|nr:MULTISPECIES: helix-turn-helix transcriptional regulator [unclassified Pseudomonas]MDH4763061.1 helix-turn-helix domain-containing protein [Pseudomonas sp. CBMAI 2609]MDR6178397.1 transcriptional regulator with XRE-family HTH domain [Pseudomonas sp. SORGH_AS_0211]